MGVQLVEMAVIANTGDGVKRRTRPIDLGAGRGRFNEAIPKLLLAVQEDASYHQPNCCVADYFSPMGRVDGTQEIVEQLRAIAPIVMPNVSYAQNAEERELLLSGPRLTTGETT